MEGKTAALAVGGALACAAVGFAAARLVNSSAKDGSAAAASSSAGCRTTSGCEHRPRCGSAVHIDSHSAKPHLHAYPADDDSSAVSACETGLTPVGHTVVTSGRRPSKPVNGFCPVIVGVAGASGSGKTSIAELIAARLKGGHVLSISSDNYYKCVESQDDGLPHVGAAI